MEISYDEKKLKENIFKIDNAISFIIDSSLETNVYEQDLYEKYREAFDEYDIEKI